MDRHKRLFLLCGAVHSGKTTRLKEWVQNTEAADGILAPVVAGERHLCHIASEECRNLHKGLSAHNRVSVGRFVFNNDVFLWAGERLRSLKTHAGIIVVDEVGPLELSGRGLEPGLGRLLEAPCPADFIFVVRESLEQAVRAHYAPFFKQVTVIGPEELSTINPAPDISRRK